MKNALLTFVSLVFLAIPTIAHAQLLPPNQVELMSRAAQDRMAGAMANGKLITQEEASKLAFPLVPYDVRERTIIAGNVSGAANWCGLSWDKLFFMPYMNNIRSQYKDWNDYQYAYVAILHGVAMSAMIQAKTGQTCTEQEKEDLLVAARR